MVIQEYMDLIYHNYDKMMYRLPTGAGSNMGILKILHEEMEKHSNYTLFLTQNKMLVDQLFGDFSHIINKDLSKHSINTFYQNEKGSMIIFRSFNTVEHHLFDDIDNIVLFNVSLQRNNEQTLKLIENIKKANNKIILLNCNLRFNVKDVIVRRLGRDNFYINEPFLFNNEKLLEESNRIKMDIRNKKIKKIKQLS